jgi:hypothetical protein
VCADGAYAVREILLWTLYRGEVVWNRQRKRDRWGVKKYLDRPEAEWLRIEAEALRLVPEELWRGAHRRLDAARAIYAGGWRATDRPDQEKYLLSGIATCKTCGGSLVAFTRDYKRGWGQRGRFYGCSFNQTPAGSARFTSSAGSELDLPFEGAALCG